MTVTIDLRPETEAGLASLAAERGFPLPNTSSACWRIQLPGQGKAALAPAERATAWRESVKDLPHTAPLSDAAISRESIYDTRG